MKRTIPLTPIAKALGQNQLVQFKQHITWKQHLANMGHYLLNLLSGDGSPYILQQLNPEGVDRWSVYDPYSQKEHRFNSEEEVRIWLEQRYYQ